MIKKLFEAVILITAIIIGLYLSSCSTATPVVLKQQIPEPANMLLVQCEQLEKIQESATVAQIATTIINNYERYYNCADLVKGWQDYYNVIKKN